MRPDQKYRDWIRGTKPTVLTCLESAHLSCTCCLELSCSVSVITNSVSSWWCSGSVLVTGPKGRWFEPGQGDGFLKAIKIRSTPSFGWEVKLEAHVVRFYGMLKISWSPTGTDRLNSHFLRPFSYSLQRCLCWQDRQSTGGRQSALADKLGVSPSWYHHTMVHIKITRGTLNLPLVGFSL
jgi:hypothetical protein